MPPAEGPSGKPLAPAALPGQWQLHQRAGLGSVLSRACKVALVFGDPWLYQSLLSYGLWEVNIPHWDRNLQRKFPEG